MLSSICPIRISVWDYHKHTYDKNTYIEVDLPIVPRVGDLVTITNDKFMELAGKMFAEKNYYCGFYNTKHSKYDIKGTTQEDFIKNMSFTGSMPVLHVIIDGIQNCVLIIVSFDMVDWNDNTMIAEDISVINSSTSLGQWITKSISRNID